MDSDASRPKQIITAYRDYLNGQDDEGQAIRMTNLEQASPLSIPLYTVIMFFFLGFQASILGSLLRFSLP